MPDVFGLRFGTYEGLVHIVWGKESRDGRWIAWCAYRGASVSAFLPADAVMKSDTVAPTCLECIADHERYG